VHIVLICTLANGEKYVLDVGFGGEGPTRPVRLVEDSPIHNLGTQELRYVYEPLPQNAPRPFTAPQKYWIYQYRNGPDKPWNSFYCFGEQEFLVNDFNVMNFFTSAGKTFQRVTILIVKFIRNTPLDTEVARITGKLMLVNGTVKRNLGGRTEVVQQCHSEAERIDALKRWFGITLTDEEQGGIKGLVTELKEPEQSIENGKAIRVPHSKIFDNVGGLAMVGTENESLSTRSTREGGGR
jgi:arylamine N-acetyltransferase